MLKKIHLRNLASNLGFWLLIFTLSLKNLFNNWFKIFHLKENFWQYEREREGGLGNNIKSNKKSSYSLDYYLREKNYRSECNRNQMWVNNVVKNWLCSRHRKFPLLYLASLKYFNKTSPLGCTMLTVVYIYLFLQRTRATKPVPSGSPWKWLIMSLNLYS